MGTPGGDVVEHEHSAEARALLAEFDADLAASSEERGGDPLEWSPGERAVLSMIADAVDRKVDLYGHYRRASDAKLQLDLAKELRLLEGNIVRLLAKVKTDMPPPPSRTSEKARRAVKSRWDRDRAQG